MLRRHYSYSVIPSLDKSSEGFVEPNPNLKPNFGAGSLTFILLYLTTVNKNGVIDRIKYVKAFLSALRHRHRDSTHADNYCFIDIM